MSLQIKQETLDAALTPPVPEPVPGIIGQLVAWATKVRGGPLQVLREAVPPDDMSSCEFAEYLRKELPECAGSSYLDPDQPATGEYSAHVWDF